jgi:hypothetical protein
MGVAFEGVRFAGGLFPCASFNRREKLQFVLGGGGGGREGGREGGRLRYGPPEGFRAYGEVVGEGRREGRRVREMGGLVRRRRRRREEGEMEVEGEEEEEEEEDEEEGREDEEEEEEEDYVEDCMEEVVGMEGMRALQRYFSADGRLNGSSSSSSSSKSRKLTNVWLSEEEKKRGGTEGRKLVRQALELCVLYARKAVLTMLSTWPEKQQKPMVDLARLLADSSSSSSSGSSSGAPALIDLLRLVSVVSPATTAHLAKVSLLPISSLDGGGGGGGGGREGGRGHVQACLAAGGAPTLYAITPALARAIEEGLEDCLSPIVKGCVLQQLLLAMDRSALFHALWPQQARGGGGGGGVGGLTYLLSAGGGGGGGAPAAAAAAPPGQEEEELFLKQPNLCLAVWATGLLLSRGEREGGREGEPPSLALPGEGKGGREGGMSLVVTDQLAGAWCLALRSPFVQLKTMACSILASMLQEVLVEGGKEGGRKVGCVLGHLAGREGGREGLGRLRGMALQRVWAERADHPIYSRYAQALIELVSSIKLAEASLPPSLPSSSSSSSSMVSDPSFPLEPPPLPSDDAEEQQHEQFQQQQPRCREWEEGLVASDEGWEIWSGTVTQQAVSWKKPQRRGGGGGGGGGREMEGGEGPPLLVPGRKVIRGPDWVEVAKEGGKEGGKEEEAVVEQQGEELVEGEEEKEKKKASLPPSVPASDPKKLMVGVVQEIVDWVEEEDEEGREDGVFRQKGKARRVKWADGEEGVYRWGANGCFDLTQVEVGRDGKTILKRYSFPNTTEGIAARHGFGQEWHCGVALWIRPTPNSSSSSSSSSSSTKFEGICEWPDQGAATWVSGEKGEDGSISFREERLLVGSDMVWTRRFGAPQWRAGLEYSLKLLPEEGGGGGREEGGEVWGGECVFGSSVRLGGEVVRVREVVRMQKRDLFSLDRHAKAGSISVSDDGRSASCSSSDSKALVYGSVGFARGVHYWEVKIEQEEVGSIFLGVAEKPDMMATGAGAAMRGAVHRWHGYGFINYRASFAWNPADAAAAAAAAAVGGAGALVGVSPERPYGENFQAGDIVGIKLDMDRGVLSFFLDGMKYGEHILAELGVAHEGLLGGGRGAERVRPRVLFPVIG